MRIERDRKRVQRFDRMRCSGKPHRLLAPQEFAVTTAFRMHRDDKIEGLAEPIRQVGSGFISTWISG